jgi:hypothetical protein
MPSTETRTRIKINKQKHSTGIGTQLQFAINWSRKGRPCIHYLYFKHSSSCYCLHFLFLNLPIPERLPTTTYTCRTFVNPWCQDLCKACLRGNSVTHPTSMHPTDEIDATIPLRTCSAIAPVAEAGCRSQHKAELARSGSTKHLASFGWILNSCHLATRVCVVRSRNVKTRFSLFFSNIKQTPCFFLWIIKKDLNSHYGIFHIRAYEYSGWSIILNSQRK